MKWLSKILGRTKEQQTRDFTKTTFNSNDIKVIFSKQEVLEKDIEKMAAEIMVVAYEFLDELKKEITIDSEKETKIALILFPLFIHIHDRILFARFGDKARTLYIDGIADSIYEMFKFMFEKGNQNDLESFRNYLNEYQVFFFQYKEIISDSKNLSNSLIWNTTNLIMKEINAEKDYGLFLKLYTFFCISVMNFSVHKIESII